MRLHSGSWDRGDMMEKIVESVKQINEAMRKEKSYNIFSVLQIQAKEVLTCRMIADLLNPRGQHGSGAAYLKLFLQNVLQVDVPEESLEQAVITTEYEIGNERRIDIVIEVDEFFLPIEVKIYAGEQKSQCHDYYYFAKRKDHKAKVYYLTLDGHFPSEYSTVGENGAVPVSDIVCLSFGKDILGWLGTCKTVGNPQMQSILDQFMESVETVGGYRNERLVNMVSEELVQSEETLKAGIQIADSINTAKAKVLYRLFQEFEEQLEPVARKNHWSREQTKNWYEYRDMANAEYYKYTYSTFPGINYVVNDVKLNNGYQLWFRVEVEHRLYAGFCVFDPNGQEGAGAQVDLFDKATREAVNTYLRVSECDQDYWWADWWYLPGGGKRETEDVPDFKEMNDAAIALTDERKRKEFVAECIRQTEHILEKTIKNKCI